MKKQIVIFSVFLLSLGAHAQLRNEMKVNMAKIVFGFSEISYEYIVSRHISTGASLGAGTIWESLYKYNFMASPYFRIYIPGVTFSHQNYSTGLFVEGNASFFKETIHEPRGTFSLTHGEPIYGPDGKIISWNNIVTDTRHTVTHNPTGMGVGAALGYKHVKNKKYSFEAFIGMGNNFNPFREASGYVVNKYYPHFGIAFGKRF